MIYFSIKFVRGACRAPRLCARNYGKYIAVSDVGIADTKSIRDIGSLRKGGSRWQPQQPQSELLFGGSWWLEFVGNANRTRNGRAQLAALGCLFWVQPVHKGFATELGYQNRCWLHTSTQ